MKFSFSDGKKFGWDGISGTGIASIESGTVSYVEVNEKHGKVKTLTEDRF